MSGNGLLSLSSGRTGSSVQPVRNFAVTGNHHRENNKRGLSVHDACGWVALFPGTSAHANPSVAHYGATFTCLIALHSILTLLILAVFFIYLHFSRVGVLDVFAPLRAVLTELPGDTLLGGSCIAFSVTIDRFVRDGDPSETIETTAAFRTDKPNAKRPQKRKDSNDQPVLA